MIPGEPFAYLVVQASGYIVGGWKDKNIAEQVAAKKPAFDKETVVPVFKLEDLKPVKIEPCHWPVNTIVMHNKTENVYIITGHAVIEKTSEPAYIYSRYLDTTNKSQGVRPAAEFHERFSILDLPFQKHLTEKHHE